MRTSTNFAHLASFQAIEFVDRPIPKTLDFLYVRQAKTKLFFTKHSATFLQISFPSPVSMLSARTTSHFDPHSATEKKNGLHYMTPASFTEAPVKTESKLLVILSSACYILLRSYILSFWGSTDLVYVEPKCSDNNFTSHFLELLPIIIIQDNRKAPLILFLNVNL